MSDGLPLRVAQVSTAVICGNAAVGSATVTVRVTRYHRLLRNGSEVRTGQVAAVLYLVQWNSSSAGERGSISGMVKDNWGAVLPGTKIVVLNQDVGISRTIETDAGGHYSVQSLHQR
jgi:hypothetical protein